MEEKAKTKDISKTNIHALQSYSYTFYFFMLLLGILLDLFFPVGIPAQSVLMPISVFLLIIASILILWAQIANRNLKKESITKETFSKDPA